MRYELLVTKGPDAGLRFPITSHQVTVGRSSEMALVLTDPAVLPRHFVVEFGDGAWRAITFEPKATILIDRRWEHPRTRQRGARIFVGNSQLLLLAGEGIELAIAQQVSEGLDIDAETLRDDALTTVGNEAYEFRDDMKGKAARVSDPKRGTGGRRVRGSGGPGGADDSPTVSSEPSNAANGARRGANSMMFQAQGGMMPLPATIEEGRRSQAPNAGPPKSARWTDGPPSGAGAKWPDSKGAPQPTPSPGAKWPVRTPAPSSGEGVPRSRALAKGQTISLTDTAIGAMPSSSRDLHVLYEKDGPFASELRILATRLEDMKTSLGYKSFLFTSVNANEGKTVVASNLALAMSEDSERKIALVDANFRSPRAGELFNLDSERGILTAIAGERPLSECVARVIGRNLIVLSAGGGHNNPAQILSDPKFKTLLAELSQAVDFMIVDAPSAIPHADVPLLAQHVDGVFMVIGANGTKAGDVDRAVETIGKNRVQGAIFVNPPTGKKSGKKKKKK